MKAKSTYETPLQRTCDNYRKILCPYCGHKHEREPNEMPWDDDDDKEDECEFCEKPFKITAHVTTRWTTDGVDE
ncbi:MAG: hypothetical protein WC130_03715 [Kiritimatiellia bacterium]